MEWLRKCNRLCTCNDFHPNMVRFDLFQQKTYNNYYNNNTIIYYNNKIYYNKFLLSSFVFIYMEVKVQYFFLKCMYRYVELELFVLILRSDCQD